MSVVFIWKPGYLISFFLCLGAEKSPLELWKAEWTKHEELESEVQEERCKYAVTHRLAAPAVLGELQQPVLPSYIDKALG